MALDQSPPRGIAGIASHLPGTPVIPRSPAANPVGPTGAPVTAEESTPLLRRCTEVAARARVELLSEQVHVAADELRGVLTAIESWEGRELADAEPSLLALACAALEDLAERTPGPADSEERLQIERAVVLLRRAQASPSTAAIA